MRSMVEGQAGDAVQAPPPPPFGGPPPPQTGEIRSGGDGFEKLPIGENGIRFGGRRVASLASPLRSRGA